MAINGEVRYGGWLAFLRIYNGLLWLAYGATKFEPDWVGGKQEFFDAVRFAAKGVGGGPIQGFLTNVVLPHQAVFGQLIAIGETLVGLGLVFGLATGASAIGAMFLSGCYYLATGKYSFLLGVESLELVLFAMALFLLVTPSNQALSLDRWLGRFRRRSSD
jgi:thiosulfate dehydrogenase [quinone] large subunit